MPFRLKFPYSYTNPDSAAKRYSMMLFWHGAGEPGCFGFVGSSSPNGWFKDKGERTHCTEQQTCKN